MSSQSVKINSKSPSLGNSRRGGENPNPKSPNSSNTSLNQISSHSEMQRRWLEDSAVDNCMLCYTSFSFLKRKHHCRYCGNIYCAKCSNRFMTLEELKYHQPVRVCETCYEFLTQLRRGDISPDMSSSPRESLFSSASEASDLSYESHFLKEGEEEEEEEEKDAMKEEKDEEIDFIYLSRE